MGFEDCECVESVCERRKVRMHMCGCGKRIRGGYIGVVPNVRVCNEVLGFYIRCVWWAFVLGRGL